MDPIGSHWTDCYEKWHLRIFRKYVDKIQAKLKSGRKIRYFIGRPG
jgi:hypothetical protein